MWYSRGQMGVSLGSEGPDDVNSIDKAWPQATWSNQFQHKHQKPVDNSIGDKDVLNKPTTVCIYAAINLLIKYQKDNRSEGILGTYK